MPLHALVVLLRRQAVPRRQQAKELVLEVLAELVGDIVVGIFGPRKPALTDREVLEAVGGDGVDVILVLVRDDGNVDVAARLLLDVRDDVRSASC